MKLRNIKSKKPFTRPLPDMYLTGRTFNSNGTAPEYKRGVMSHQVITQSDMVLEYYPSSHRINDVNWYPNVFHMTYEKILDQNGEPIVDESGMEMVIPKLYEEKLPRLSFNLQQIIYVNHQQTLSGNDIQHELCLEEPSDEQVKMFNDMQSGWHHDKMEHHMFQAIRSWLITGDTAIAFAKRKNEFGEEKIFVKPLSFLNGDTLYPHYDRFGELEVFARSYYDYDDKGEQICEWLEVWDKTNYTRYRRSEAKGAKLLHDILGIFGLTGYEIVDGPEPHSAPFVPVAYARNEEGPCWSGVQNNIEQFELSCSQMSQNNKSYGEPVMVLRSEGGAPADMMRNLNGTVKQITLTGEKDEVKMMQGESAADSFMKELELQEKYINCGSFTVVFRPSDLKSGDTPGITVKLIYSPAVSKGNWDGEMLADFVNDTWKCYSFFYGLVNANDGKIAEEYATLPVMSWIKPYIHQNDSALVADHVALVGSGIESKQTASERLSEYTMPGEQKRVRQEAKDKQNAELLYEEKILRAENTYKSNEDNNRNN